MCNKYLDFMKAQQELIERHIDEHKWCLHIKDKNEAVMDFIEKFGWCFRESYCMGCPEYKVNGVLCDAFVESLR